MIIPLRSRFACRPCRSRNDTAGTCQASLGGHPSSFGWPQSAGQKETNDGGDGGQRVGFQRGRNPEVRGVAPQLLSFVTSYLKDVNHHLEPSAVTSEVQQTTSRTCAAAWIVSSLILPLGRPEMWMSKFYIYWFQSSYTIINIVYIYSGTNYYLYPAFKYFATFS